MIIQKEDNRDIRGSFNSDFKAGKKYKWKDDKTLRRLIKGYSKDKKIHTREVRETFGVTRNQAECLLNIANDREVSWHEAYEIMYEEKNFFRK